MRGYCQHSQYGEIFTILLFGRKMTYFMTPEAADYFFNARHEDVSAELAYAPLTVPVFGKDVVYDVPYAVLVEQKKSAGSPCALAPRYKRLTPVLHEAHGQVARSDAVELGCVQDDQKQPLA